MTRQIAEANGVKTAYARSGVAGAPTVVLAHPLGVNADVWAYQLPLLESGFDVLRYDLRGHGESAATGDEFSLETLADDVAGLLDQLRLGPVTFLGLSIGGMIGQAFALRHADRLAGLILCSTGARTEPAAKAGLADRIAKARAEGMTSQVPRTLENWFTAGFRESSPATTGWVADLIRGTSVDGFVGCCRAVQGLDYLDRLGEIQTRTLLIAGAEDKNFPPATMATMRERMPDATLEVLPGAAHLGSVEVVHRFNEAVLGFLGKTR